MKALTTCVLAAVLLAAPVRADDPVKEPAPRSEAKDQAPDWTAKDVHTGEKVTLQGLRGKWVLMDFWATWCMPCRLLMQTELTRLFAGYEKRTDFVLVGIGAGDETAEAQARFADAHGFRWRKVLDENDAVAKAYGVESIPHLVLVDPEGKVVVAGNGFLVMKRVKELLAQRLGPPGKPAEPAKPAESKPADAEPAKPPPTKRWY